MEWGIDSEDVLRDMWVPSFVRWRVRGGALMGIAGVVNWGRGVASGEV
jgi:hypothetical protein